MKNLSSAFKSFRRSLRLWRREREGVAAVEFALVATPLFIMIVGQLEICMYYAAGIALEGAATSAARTLRTGQAQQSGDAFTTFQDRLCDNLGILVPCDEVSFEVIEIPDGSFLTAEDLEPQFDDDGNLVEQGFDAGGVESTLIVRVGYRYNFMTPLLGEIIAGESGTSSGYHMATIVMRNEPYKFQ